ncbi:uncharacterized protein AKAW2_40742A [Aspergillus luchuensis]|uniref:Uncharacterized protein n=1 Tax=Aspergillus kawachii TaxID=1069201 RepID=A0A7R7WA38_ASPKA|nr:uncharacterized protein AKAW2_40742A [Aspergillus luchuensis]BCR99059.1 hypothetical protein AKAW2_40742A [Aspergillus luchuensis]
MGRRLPSPGGSQLPNVHRYILRQDELLEMMLAIGPQKHQAERMCVSSLRRQGENDLLQEHRAPLTVFSVEALLQVQWRAFCLPQEHLAWAAQTQLPSPEVLQQVEEGWTILTGY